MMRIKKNLLTAFSLLVIYIVLFLYGCKPINVYEKTVSIPGFSWKSSYKPQFHFIITDSISNYQLFLIFRHNEKYSFNNIYFSLYTRFGKDTTTQKLTMSAPLATNEKGWLGTAMDDVYDHRIKLGLPQTLRKGDYYFTLEQIMREDPLKNVLDVGIRVEKLSRP